ncbi:rCG44671 [Rattus norvegicus]|uniref:RCG44671 n=1 Tax=Rattus norvegicus TaxID=10116 RepID=A6I5C7_RAT|nr:rCG44671 [Rattus norvegicus]
MPTSSSSMTQALHRAEKLGLLAVKV